MTMAIGNDYKDKYAMFGSLSAGLGQNGMQGANLKKEEPIDFSTKSIEGLGGKAEVGKTTNGNQNVGINLGFVDRLDRMDAQNTLNHPTHASSVDGYDNGLAKFIDYEA